MYVFGAREWMHCAHWAADIFVEVCEVRYKAEATRRFGNDEGRADPVRMLGDRGYNGLLDELFDNLVARCLDQSLRSISCSEWAVGLWLN